MLSEDLCARHAAACLCTRSSLVGSPDVPDGDALAEDGVDFHLGQGDEALDDENYALASYHFERAAACCADGPAQLEGQENAPFGHTAHTRLLCKCRRARVLYTQGGQFRMQEARLLIDDVIRADGQYYVGHATLGHWLLQEAEVSAIAFMCPCAQREGC